MNDRTVDVLAIGAHAGDEVAWGMALAACRRQGLRTGLLHLTPGEKGHPKLSPAEYAVQKRDEANACAQVLGATLWMLDYGDGELLVDEPTKWAIADVLRVARPRLVITHWGGSIHRDHSAVHHLLPDARFLAGLPAFPREDPPHWVPKVLYGENWEDLRDYQPETYLMLIQEDVETWERAMRCYALFRGEVAKFRYLDYYKALAITRGCEVYADVACTFAVPPEARRHRTAQLLDLA